jgi:hypothetical protein
MKKTVFAWLAVASLAAPGVARAATEAYWRHEQGPNGALIPAGPDSVLDSSGNGNNMRTFDPTFTSATYSNVVSPVPLRSGLPNTLSLDFGPGGDDAGQNDDNYSEGKPINTKVFTAMTVEVAFRMDSIGGFQAILGKDGKPLGDAPGEDNSPVPPFKLMVRGDNFPNAINNQLFVEWIDGDGTLNADDHFLAGGETVQVDKWYHVAVTLSPTVAQLWVAGETGPYLLKDSLTGQDFTGPAGEVLVQDPTNWSIGRGMFGNNVTDWSNAHIDEVRISDTVLATNQFLFNAVPEPGGIALSLAGLLGLCRAARRKAA